ncbi:NAD(P)/FAD-dependent oxidoreductase [Terrabacter sp. MAHUQ-38]|uniref:NAD(P)/FAD-dependent oxidoreductase n=1 Tax=unclassified Terrabacter TaxID=2630222 RepID=UPI00165DDF98|nr:FAD-dependent oxidoreductase [Terrabacter sp. MAHUQ-38]MBC9821508.1 FAD-dependent oxidoreductase [Terrabacter sp. MAHUQ-38]
MEAQESGILVVGAGQAGISLVTALRELGDLTPVVLVGDESEPPYERPPLSKSYLRGEHDRASLVFRDRSWFAEHGVELVTGDAVVDLERETSGGRATTASGRVITFERLALTTGATNRLLPVDGATLDGVHAVRTLADADRLAPELARARRVVVVGGGFIGLEIAAGARTLGSEVTVVEATDRLLARAVTATLSEFVRDAHERRGTRILLDASAVRVHGDGSRAAGVELADGTTLSADVVVVGIGVVPRTELAERLGLRVDPQGIVVDAHALTSDGVTVAAGDCAVGPNPFTRGLPGPTRLESVPHATDQARAAAATLASHPTAYDQVPWFWSDQGDLRLQMAGLSAGADHVVVRGDVAAERFSVLSYREGLLVAVESVGSSADYLAVKRALEKGMTIEAEAAADPAVPLKRLITRAHAAPSS